eukprot:NODE_307_length_2984_cov_95.594547_g265_i0.p1 GENE.NODE_307_length_2984_cov_95.594547_g265_i0~~NODE_307_length_2984_cov_95.594547_g265_i0.p1  ORF type:complete len:770 (+),score=165.48 NODE_307_length_2984_cov_95.594547_g265_i0:178-2487(+)
MAVVFVFILGGVRIRLRKPTHIQRYGPLYLVGIAIPLIVADLWRHILQDESLTVFDLFAIILFIVAIVGMIFSRMVFTGKPWGPFDVPTSKILKDPMFQNIPMAIFALGIVFVFISHNTDGWFGSSRLSWPECGDNPTFPRTNQTWSSTCTWSSSQYRCNSYCCVPGDGHAGLIPDLAPGSECTCHCIPDNEENMKHLSPMGILFTIFFTYLGFVLLAFGTLWNASIIDKLKEIRETWRELRGTQDFSSSKTPYDPVLNIQVESSSSAGRMTIEDGRPIDSGEHEAQHTYQFDIVIIGGGSGGLACSKACRGYGRKVAVLDYVKPSPIGTTWGLGGTCVNVGCIPKKLMHQAGLLGEHMADSVHYGWQKPLTTHRWENLRDGVNGYINQLNCGYKNELQNKGVTYINGFGVFLDAHTLEVSRDDGQKMLLTSRRFVLAMGGRPMYPNINGAKEYCITSDDIFKLNQDPGKVLVVGASYVALECAGFLRSIGKEVTVMMRSIPLRGFDQEMAQRIVDYMQELGIKFIKSGVPQEVQLDSEGRRKVDYVVNNVRQSETFDTVLLAIGRKPCTQGVGLERAGVRLSTSGKVLVNKWDRTSVPHIYAIGDIQEGGLELTPVAIQAGRMLADRLYGGSNVAMDYINVPTTVFTPVEYGCCGYSEDDAIKHYGEENIEVYHSQFVPLEWKLANRSESTCYLKLVCNAREDMKIVGFHVVCPNAGEITQGVAVAMKMGAKKSTFDSTVGIHPTIAEEMTTLSITKRSAAPATKEGC